MNAFPDCKCMTSPGKDLKYPNLSLVQPKVSFSSSLLLTTPMEWPTPRSTSETQARQTTQKKQESVVVQGFTLDTLQASTWPNGKAVNDLPTVKNNGVIEPVTKKDIVYVMATGLEDVI